MTEQTKFDIQFKPIDLPVEKRDGIRIWANIRLEELLKIIDKDVADDLIRNQKCENKFVVYEQLPELSPYRFAMDYNKVDKVLFIQAYEKKLRINLAAKVAVERLKDILKKTNITFVYVQAKSWHNYNYHEYILKKVIEESD